MAGCTCWRCGRICATRTAPNSREPISRISRHEDTDGDGIYDKHTVFLDKLVMPRVAFPLEDGAVLVLETDNRDMYKYTDTNGDGVADKKELFYAGRRPRARTWSGSRAG